MVWNFTIKCQLFWGFQIRIDSSNATTGPAELGVHLGKQNLADVHLLYSNRVGS